MQLSKEKYARQRIRNGSSVQIENSVTRVELFGITWQASWFRTVTLVAEFSITTSQPLEILIVLNRQRDN